MMIRREVWLTASSSRNVSLTPKRSSCLPRDACMWKGGSCASCRRPGCPADGLVHEPARSMARMAAVPVLVVCLFWRFLMNLYIFVTLGFCLVLTQVLPADCASATKDDLQGKWKLIEVEKA